MKYTFIFILVLAMISCGREATEIEEEPDMKTVVEPATKDSTDTGALDPDIGDWKPGDKGEADLEEK